MIFNKLLRAKALKVTFSFAVAIFIGGCAGGVNMLPTLSQKAGPTTNQGVVVVRVINASAYPLPFNQVTITPKNVNESKKIKPSRLQALPIATTSSTIFSAPVSSGSYALDSIRAFHMRGDYWYSRWAGADAQFGTFEVEAGKVTDLGTIIYYPKPQEDKYLNTVLRQPSPQPAEILSDYFSFHQFSPEQVLTWTEDEYNEERDALYASVVQNPVTFNTKYLAPDNTVYFVGKLGVILKRTPSKEWELDAVETDLDLSAISQNQHGDIVVGGDEGVAFFKPLNGEWQNISLDKSHHIEEFHFDNSGNIEVISRQETLVHVMTKPISNLSEQWQTLATYDAVNGWKDNAGNKQVIVKEQDDKKKKAKQKKKSVKRIVSASTNRESNTKTITITQQSMRDNFAFATGDSKTFTFDPVNWSATAFENTSKIEKEFDAGAVKVGIEFAGFWSLNGKSTYYKQDINTGAWNKMATSIKSCNDGYEISGNLCISTSDKKARIKVKYESFNFTSMPWFSSNTNGVAIVSFSDYSFWTGQRSNEIKIIKTDDGGKNWQKTDYKLPNEFCTRLVSEVKDSILLSCNGVSSDFYESNDLGKTWIQVREHENF